MPGKLLNVCPALLDSTPRLPQTHTHAQAHPHPTRASGSLGAVSIPSPSGMTTPYSQHATGCAGPHMAPPFQAFGSAPASAFAPLPPSGSQQLLSRHSASAAMMAPEGSGATPPVEGLAPGASFDTSSPYFVSSIHHSSSALGQLV